MSWVPQRVKMGNREGMVVLFLPLPLSSSSQSTQRPTSIRVKSKLKKSRETAEP